jgi:hypothetical protein
MATLPIPDPAFVLRWLIKQLGIPIEKLCFDGDIRFREIPAEWSAEDYRCYYPAMTERDRQRLTVHEVHNILTSSGRTQILSYIGNGSANSAAFAQYFALGTFPVNSVNPGDTSVQGEIFRVAPSSATITGTQVDIYSQIGTTQAVGTLTNGGLYGINATSASGSGTLMTHALLNNFVKASGQAYSIDYLINLT